MTKPSLYTIANEAAQKLGLLPGNDMGPIVDAVDTAYERGLVEGAGLTNALVSAMARRCGLEDPSAFAAKGGAFAGAATPDQAEIRWGIEIEPHERDPLHGTGRTTRMLLTALVASEIGCVVLIEAEDPGAAGLLSSSLTTLMTKAGATWRWRGTIVFTWPGNPNAPVWTPDVHLVDHRAGGLLQAQNSGGRWCRGHEIVQP